MKNRKLPKVKRHSSLTVIFKGLDRCNANCSFCCVGETQGRVISLPDFALAARQLKEVAERWHLESLQFTFHGGEPTLLAPDYIEAICLAIKGLAPSVSFNMQSNLLNLPPGVHEMLKRYDVKLGTSVDPLGVDRLDKAGNSLFWGWLRTYLEIAHQGPAPGAIYVVTRNSLGRAEEIYSICEAIGNLTGEQFALQINHVYPQGMASRPDSAITISPQEFGQFLVDIWKIWERRGRSVSLSPIKSFADFFKMQTSANEWRSELSCSFGGSCARTHVGIDMDMNVAACGRRLDSKGYIGNLHSDSLIALLEKGEEIIAIENRPKKLHSQSPCKDCKYYFLCQGGCPDDAWLENGDISRHHPWCESFRFLFSTMESEIAAFRRPPARPAEKPPAGQPKPKIVIVRDPAELPAGGDGIAEAWLLPYENENWLRFDSGLADKLMKLGGAPVRLWCRNNQAVSLMLWEDILRMPRVSICLFEAEGIEQALNVLNSLNATIDLDVVSIIEKGGLSSLDRALERITGDPLWESQVIPISDMLRTVIEDGPARFLDRYGLTPGRFSLQVARDNSDGTISSTVKETCTTDLSAWVRGRAGCFSCRHFRMCGTRFCLGSEITCEPGIIALLDRIYAQGEKMRSVMRAVIDNRRLSSL